jgi:DNA-binding beta-propeller fold protein YncE
MKSELRSETGESTINLDETSKAPGKRSIQDGPRLEVTMSIGGGKCDMASWAICTILLMMGASEPAITTAAGTGQTGDSGDGGPAVSARLNMPFDMAFDFQGHLFFSDTFNHRIRRIDRTTGTITTVAGTGHAGFSGDGGAAVQAQFNEPYGVVVDRNGNLFVADRLNRRIRRIDGRTRMITTVAGNGTKVYSGDGGPGPEAGLVEPNGVALSRDGKMLFIADVAGNRIRMLDLAGGRISTFAGTGRNRHDGDGGRAALASIAGARAVDVGPDGSVFILEREGNSLRVVSVDNGTITTIAGSGVKGYTGDGGPAQSATFNGPKELAVDSAGNIWIVDTENHAIRFIEASAKQIWTVAGTGKAGGDGDGGPAIKARLDRPHGVAIGPDGSCWIADTNNHRLRRVVPGH